MIKKEKIYAYALKNAIQYEGKCKVESVISSLFHEGLKKQDVGKIINQVKDIVGKVNDLDLEEQKKQFERLGKQVDKRKAREGLPELPGVKKSGVIMRFSPSPSGPLHIGHALAGMPSALYVKKYGGKFILRIEDTNPENIYEKAYKMIPIEAKWLFGKISKINIQSDRMNKYYSYAEKLIKKDKAYVCTCTQKEIQENRKLGRECSCRKIHSVKEHVKRWKQMLSKSKSGFKSGKAVLSFKGNMQDKNPALRDFSLARINNKKHARQGKKYKVWPLMNLAVSVDDIEEKVTHIIRGKDHRENAKRQKLVFKALGIKKIPFTAFLGRIHFTDLELSSTKFKQGIKSKKYKGWDDPKLPTIASLMKQGFNQKLIESFVIERGLSEVDKKINKKDFFEVLKKFE